MAAAAERERLLLSAMAQLTLGQRRVLILRYGDGHSLVRIAEICEVSVPAVHAMHCRALARLRGLLAARGVSRLTDVL
jgi:RNA polymerase sigma factor (sigma-70 family)